MTLADLFKELHDTAKERIKNPIIGAFVCSFLVYNWRSIFILCFSELPVEERIEFVNTMYCNKWAIIIPLIFAIVYTLLIPLVMIGMDYGLMPMKRKRIANIYQNKGFTTDQKIIHAEKEFQLKNAESGNKDRQALLDQIETLQNSKTQIEETNNRIVSNLNEKLEEANRAFSETIEFKDQRISELQIGYDLEKNSLATYKILLAIIAHIDKYDVTAIKEMGDSSMNLNMVTSISPERFQRLSRYGLVEKKSDIYILTSLGRELYSAVKELTIE